MSYLNPWQSYRQVSTQTASPGHLVVMLYDGAIKFLGLALNGFGFEDPLEFNSTINNNVVRAQQILTELNSSLDMERGGELSTTLRKLYHYIDQRLTQSNLKKTPEGIEESVRHLTVLRDAWREMLSSASNEATAADLSLSACG
ncbi:MAG TPA: flagellar export chaperone FliS [Candidatus Acidoferrum sp.]|nr:flagellar export chaperone FliS [Candidatus Acidoferrum sp.]